MSTNSTSTLWKHKSFKSKKYPLTRNKGQQILSFQTMGQGDDSSNSNKLVHCSFNQERSIVASANMIIIGKLSFRSIEHEGFFHLSVIQPEFKFLARNTIVKDCLSIYARKEVIE